MFDTHIEIVKDELKKIPPRKERYGEGKKERGQKGNQINEIT